MMNAFIIAGIIIAALAAFAFAAYAVLYARSKRRYNEFNDLAKSKRKAKIVRKSARKMRWRAAMAKQGKGWV